MAEPKKTLTRSEIAAKLHEELGLTQSDALKIVDTFFESVSAKLEAEEAVRFANFGVFKIHTLPERIRRNPLTSEKLLKPPERQARFKPSARFLERVAKFAGPGTGSE